MPENSESNQSLQLSSSQRKLLETVQVGVPVREAQKVKQFVEFVLDGRSYIALLEPSQGVQNNVNSARGIQSVILNRVHRVREIIKGGTTEQTIAQFRARKHYGNSSADIPYTFIGDIGNNND